MDLEEVRIKKQASLTEADTAAEPDAAAEAATADVPEEIGIMKRQSAKAIRKETQAQETLNGRFEEEVDVKVEAEEDQGGPACPGGKPACYQGQEEMAGPEEHDRFAC